MLSQGIAQNAIPFLDRKRGSRMTNEEAREVLGDIELLTDTEQRIFLTAMRREREVCKTVDDMHAEHTIGSNVTLVKVCDSIERKVKKIWER